MRPGKDIQQIWESYQTVNNEASFFDELDDPDSDFNKIVKKQDVLRQERVLKKKDELKQFPEFNEEQFDMLNKVFNDRAPDGDNSQSYSQLFPWVGGIFSLRDESSDQYIPNFQTTSEGIVEAIWETLDRVDPGNTDKQEWVYSRIVIEWKVPGRIHSAKYSVKHHSDHSSYLEDDTHNYRDIPAGALDEEKSLREWLLKVYTEIRREQIDYARHGADGGDEDLSDWDF